MIRVADVMSRVTLRDLGRLDIGQSITSYASGSRRYVNASSTTYR